GWGPGRGGAKAGQRAARGRRQQAPLRALPDRARLHAAPPLHGTSLVGCRGRAGLSLDLLGEAAPVLQEVTAQLADPARGQAELLADVLGPPAGHQRVDHAAVALTTGAAPNREVDAEGGLLGHGRLGVVAQPLLEGVLRLLPQ